jgi:hypothetical protein
MKLKNVAEHDDLKSGDESIPDDLAEAIYPVYVPNIEIARALGIFAATGTDEPDDAPVSQRLLVLTGRA